MRNQRTNYYKHLAADFSRPGLVTPEQSKRLIADAERFIALREKQVPPITDDYPLRQIEGENKEWWPAHCESLRQARGDILGEEYADVLVYFCADGPFYALLSREIRSTKPSM